MPSRKKRYARVAITLPAQDLAAADRLARAHDRSRSWIVAEAIRRFAAASETGETPPATDTLLQPSGLGTSRLAQLTRDLSLTPEARVREAEETLRLTELRQPSRAHQVVTFDKYEDYLQWKRSRNRST